MRRLMKNFLLQLGIEDLSASAVERIFHHSKFPISRSMTNAKHAKSLEALGYARHSVA
jgi:hypothetical protein